MSAKTDVEQYQNFYTMTYRMLIKTFYPQEIVKGEYVFPIFTDKVRGRDQATNDLSTHVHDVTTTNQSKRHREVPRGHQCLQGSDTDRDDWRTSKLAEASVLVPKATTDTGK